MRINRRQLLWAVGVGSGLALAPRFAFAEPPAGADPVARVYYEVLSRHTRWAEQQYDPVAGRYRRTDFGFAVVLGNAVLLTRGDYDADLTGVAKSALHAHTVDTIRHFAASNVLAGGSEWGKTLFWDTTFQSYFVLAARLLWADLDPSTRAAVDAIARGQAAYTAALGTGDDPRSGGWTPNGPAGGYRGDTKLEEMGVYTQALAPGLAWAADDPDAHAWREAFGRWSRNEAGLPAADLANPAVVDGVPVSANIAANAHDTFIVENHGSYGPHYQEELWRTSGRNAAHFLLAGTPLPEVLTAQPNGERLWRTILATMSDAGEPLMPMVDDREHLYGRDVIPLAFRSQVLGDRLAARAEAALAARLTAYQAYPPVHRLAKFSGEAKYEPEARAELAISYLLHEWRNRTGPVVEPVSEEEFFASAAGVTDYGVEPGLVAHQSTRAWAGTVTKAGYVKFAWQPGHDDWLFVVGGGTPMLVPSTSLAVRGRSAVVCQGVRDGFDGTASLLAFDGGHVGTATLPTGTVVYATSGLAAGEGRVDVHNLTMPGVPGLDGSRAYTAAEGAVTVASADSRVLPPGVARVDDLVFGAVTARHVRVVGVSPHQTYGYSLFTVEVRASDGPDLARGRVTTASSWDTGREPGSATDGSHTTRWAVSRADRGRADSWLAVDLGGPVAVDRVRLYWEAAAGRAYRVETSPDGVAWSTAAEYPRPDLRSTGGWLDVDGRAGFVVHGSPNPITVTGDTVVLSDGPAAGFVVEGYARPVDLPALAAAGAPSCSPATVRASAADGFLSLFNLSDTAADGTVSLRQDRRALRLYPGNQVVTPTGTDHDLRMPPATARVEPPRFTLEGDVPVGVTAVVHNGARVTLTGAGRVARLTLVSADGHRVPVTLPPGVRRDVTIPHARPHPLADLALGRTTYPTSPLPPGMSAPSAAVDDDPDTAWTPGPAGRMVVDLGASHHIARVDLTWTAGRVPDCTVSTSTDGRTYSRPTPVPRHRHADLPLDTTARYLAVATPTWQPGHASLTSLTAHPA
ncbi:discoidin domain-containing protein [Saccharothrix texasensis]|uniref:F5/8 type C domain-containing protein n=1 Tax=Saccharothrix texasensis TaxID=103734 RepID=A0A3N1GY06_9PSEU|nr:discoidin domain-containing protein [Saccharothrix texasensis]ROP35160.1 F5/8 type C domain-containing protein [Saccharothrix texasensis]